MQNLSPLIDIGDLQPAAEATASVNGLSFILPLVVSLVISMVVIPVMVRLAPVFGMIDEPDPRKVHAIPVPRVGGVGIFLGAMTPVVLLLPIDQSLLSFIAGACILFLFGAADDCREMGHYVKFVGQFIAVLLIVYWGDVYVTVLPFTGGEPVAESVGRVFTIFAMVGMINAINHSDGLDGLAGGESMLSLACIAYLAWLAGGTSVVIIALATIGGLLGFLRFNTHPARIFMGDGGSQFLGLTLGYLAVLLTQEVNPALSPALPALILGLPVADIIVVFAKRIHGRMNWFRATRNHVHHRLLDMGFHHYESVVLVYSVQALLVVSALLFSYESDYLVAFVYLAITGSLFLFLSVGERSGLRVHAASAEALLDKAIESAKHAPWLSRAVYRFVLYCTSFLLLGGSLVPVRVPAELGLPATAVMILLAIRLVLGYRVYFLMLRPLVYVSVVFIVYLATLYQPGDLAGTDVYTYLLFGALAAGIAAYLGFAAKGDFSVTPMDYLIILAVISIAVMSRTQVIESSTVSIILKSVILFYAGELILNNMRNRWNVFTVSVLLSMLIVGIRGIIAI